MPTITIYKCRIPVTFLISILKHYVLFDHVDNFSAHSLRPL